MVANLVLYSILIILSFYVAKRSYAHRCGSSVLRDDKTVISFWAIIFIAVLCTLYNLFVTEQGISSGNIQGDRLFYSLNFAGTRKAGTVGLQWLIDFIHLFSDNSKVLFYGTTFVCVLITLVAYRKFEGAMPTAILFLILTQWIFSTIVNIKQCYCTAFATLFFVYAFRTTNLKNTLCCFIFAALAVMFHQAGYILFFVYIVIKLFHSKKSSLFLLIVCFAVFLFFEPMVLLLAKIAGPIFPSLASKINQYFLYHNAETESAISGFIKGLPFYYVTLVGFLRQKTLANKIKNYYLFLDISIIASLVYMLSIYNAWLFRLIYIFYFPIAIFFAQILANNSNRKSYYIDYFVVFGGLAVVLYRYIALMYVNYGGFSGIL